jgi:hypothetical protein
MESNPIRDFVFSAIRTIVPNVVTGVLTWLARKYDVIIDEGTKANVLLIAYGVAFAAYYLAVRLFETYVSPKFSVLLGDLRKGLTTPVYADPTKTTVIAPTDTPAPTIVTDVTPNPLAVELPHE